MLAVCQIALPLMKSLCDLSRKWRDVNCEFGPLTSCQPLDVEHLTTQSGNFTHGTVKDSSSLVPGPLVQRDVQKALDGITPNCDGPVSQFLSSEYKRVSGPRN